MVITCAAPGCSAKKDNVNSKGPVQFHRFPLRKPDVLAKWVKAMKNPNFKPTATTYLCSAHFSASDYDMKPTNAGKHLKPTAVPSLFEKRKPGRKKKIVIESEKTEEPRENEEYVENKDVIKEEYLEENANIKVESNLAEIIGDQEKGTLHVLIVGEDGKITNSEYIFKKEPYFDEEYQEGEVSANEYAQDTDEEDHSKENIDEKGNQTDVVLRYRELKQKEKMKRLENSLLEMRNKMKMLHMKCRRMNKRMNKLKILLKLLVLKRGRAEQNLKQLLEDYEKEADDVKIKGNEPDFRPIADFDGV